MVDARRDGAWRFMEVGSCCACSIGGGSALGWRVSSIILPEVCTGKRETSVTKDIAQILV